MCILFQIVLAGMGIPWLGNLFGYVIARLFKQPHADALAICIETGNQNTGIAIFLLRYALGQPEADITTGIHSIFYIYVLFLGSAKVILMCDRKHE